MNIIKKIYLLYFSKYGKIYSLCNYFFSYLLAYKIHSNNRKKFVKIKEKLNNNDYEIINIAKKISEFGYYKTNLKDIGFDNSVLDTIDKHKNEAGKKTNNFFFNNLYNYSFNDELSRFSTSENFMKIASIYLNIFPIINNIQIIKSDIADDQQYYSSMNWHLDKHHEKLIKVMILPYDLNSDDGPTCFLDKKVSKEIINNDSYFSSPIYFKDEEILSADLQYKNKINEFTGKRGDILFIDTSKCLHMGSRCRKIRFQLFITYTPILTYDINTLKSLNTFKQLNS